MARDGKWRKNSVAGKYTVLKKIIENPGINQNQVCPYNSRARASVAYLIENEFVKTKQDTAYKEHGLYVTQKGLQEFQYRT